MTEHAVRTPASVTRWQPERPRFRPLHLLRTWLFSAIALVVAAWLLPGAEQVITVPVALSTQRKAGMSMFEPRRIPAWLAPVWDERSVSQRLSW